MAFGYADHFLNDVNACDALADGVLDLQSGVHLQEVKVSLRVYQELTSTYWKIFVIIVFFNKVLHSRNNFLITLNF